MTMAMLTIDDLVVSPLNVRTNEEDAEATSGLEQSILEIGLMLPLLAHPLPDGEIAPYGVLAGGRRLRAIARLIDEGRLPRDYEIPVVIRDLSPAEITELSLAENLLRRGLRPYEVHAAIARAHEQGASIEQISTNLGQRPIWVSQHLRLGRLVPEIFEAYVAQEIDREEIRAFAATADADLQRAAWKHFSALQPYDRTPGKIRAYLKIGDAENERLLRFVDPEQYRRAGGRIELDLFAEGPEQGRVLDEGTLRQLAESKLDYMRKDLRQRTGRADLRFVAEPPKAHGFTDNALEVVPSSAGRGADLDLPSGDIVVTLVVDQGGKAESRFWWASRKAKREAERSLAPEKAAVKVTTSVGVTVAAGEAFDTSANFTAQAARAAVKDIHGLTADGLQAMRLIRREVLRAMLADDADEGGTIGRDYLVWTQLRMALEKGVRPKHVGARGLSSEWDGAEDAEPVDFVAPLLEETAAQTVWLSALEKIRAELFMTIEDPAEAFRAFYFALEKTKRRAGAVLAGFALLRSANTPGWRIGAHDVIAELFAATGEEVRRYWSPTARFVSLFPKLNRLGLAQPHVGEEEFRSWNKLNDQVLTGATVGVLAQAAGWVHPLLSFGVAQSPENGASEQSGSREAAE
jgi:ParB family chromosome partitioning protein